MKLDDNLAWLLVQNIDFLKNIHPNYITFSGIISNFLILYLLIKKDYNILIPLIIYRYFTDILDGAVARKYNKTSKLGGYLDTLNDVMLISFLSLYYLKNYFIFIFILILLFIIYHNSFYDHSQLKKKGIIAFFVNNSILLYFILSIIIKYPIKLKLKLK